MPGPAPTRSHRPGVLKRFRRRFQDPQAARRLVQGTSLALCLWLGVEFALFMRWGASGGAAPYVAHPAGAEAFLPISALLSLLSLASPLKVQRAAGSCIDCRKCTQACPARIPVHRAGRVASDACSACYRCIAACPVKDTLQVRAPGGRPVPGWVFGLLAAGLFVAITGTAMLAGHWRTALTPDDYLRLAETVGNP